MPWTKIFSQNEINISGNEEVGKRIISYPKAVREALKQALEIDSRVFIMGQGVDDPGGMFGATLDLHKEFGSQRVFDTPLSENGLTGVAIGAALTGMRPFYCHNRPDFLMLTMDQIVNHASKWSYMFGGIVNVPIVIWSVVGRGWGSAAQHSQALHGMFMHVPGLRIVVPTTPYDAKGLILSAIADNNPVLIFEHRWLFKQTGYVPEEPYMIPFGKGVVRKTGKDVTIVAISYMVSEAMKAAEELLKKGIDVEIIDPRTLKPLDEELIAESLKKTGKLIIADTGWKTGGAAAEIAAAVAEHSFQYLNKPIKRIGSADIPTPASYVLEDAFYGNSSDIIRAAEELMK